MLIQSLSLRNFRKYERLNISDLPKEGVITVSGLNESGKSSIGEAICFALFGRTLNLTKENTKKLVRWETKAASVVLSISDSNQEYMIGRSINQQGVSDATVTHSNTNTVIAQGTKAVNNTIIKLLGFGFDTFVESFYLSARDLNNPDPDSNSIKDMAGIGDYARISDELTQASIKNQQKIDELSPLIKEKEAALATVGLDETWLPELVDTHEVIDLESKAKQALSDDLTQLPALYSDKQKQHKSTLKLWRLFSISSWLLFSILFIVTLAWATFQFFPEYISTLPEQLHVSAYTPEILRWLSEWGFISLMSLVITSSATLCLKWFFEHKKETQLAEVMIFTDTINQSYNHSQRSFNDLTTSRLKQTIDTDTQHQKPLHNEIIQTPQLTEDFQTFTMTSSNVEKLATYLRDTLRKQTHELHTLQAHLDEEIIHEKARSDEAGVIRSTLQKLNNETCDHQTQIKIQTTGVQLLQRASDTQINNFNTSITNHTNKTMPLFTENRYKQIKIDNNLSVHIYSDEKMDWIDFDELSAGTQRQVLLAVRIAMSEQLAHNTDNDHQFIFLDEPFTYFDQDRTMNALDAFPHLNEATCQIWIVAQKFPEVSHTDKAIHCPGIGLHILDT